MELDKICRTCMGFAGPLLSIYDGGTASGSANCIADMLTDVTRIRPQKGDNLPEKVCLTCISEINRCYSYKMKCENSNRTLRQLIPDALPEVCMELKSIVPSVSIGIQTSEDESIKDCQTIETQTELVGMIDSILTEESTKETDSLDDEIILQDSPNIIKTDDCETPVKELKKDLIKEEPKMKKSNIIVHDLEEYEQSVNDNPNDNFIESNVYEIYEEYVLDEENNQQQMEQLQNGETEQNDFIKICNEDETSEKSAISEGEGEGEEVEGEGEDDGEGEGEVENEDDCDEDQIEYNISICNETDETKALKEETVYKAAKFQCPHCVMCFVSVKNLNKHINKRHCVSIAQTNLDNNSDLNETTQIEIVNETKKIKVNYIKPRSDLELLEPAPRLVKTKPKPMEYKCEQCKASFALKKSLLYHYRLHACTVKSFSCSECGRVFNTEENLMEHKSTHILSNSCNECLKVFPTKEELTQHMIDAHNRKARNQCTICMKVFTMLSTLKDHMRIHTGEKPFVCPICYKGFNQNTNLKQHLIRHSDNKPFKCDECPKTYCTRAEYYSHKRTHTGDQPFRCDYCDARFTTNSSMVKHRRKHTGERPYACDMCPMRFTSSNVMKNHRRTHTGEKPYKCAFCPKVFNQKGDCQNHQRNHLQNQTHSVNTRLRRSTFSDQKIEKQEFVSEDEYQEQDHEQDQEMSADDTEPDGTEEANNSENEVVLMEINLD